MVILPTAYSIATSHTQAINSPNATYTNRYALPATGTIEAKFCVGKKQQKLR
jgi:hypothetical protein